MLLTEGLWSREFVGDFKATWDKGPWSTFYGLNVIGGVSNEQDLRNARQGQVCFSRQIQVGYPGT